MGSNLVADRLIESLKKKNLRVTNARKAIYEILSKSEKSLSAQSVYSQIQKTSGLKTDKVSVYRNLSLFSELGLVHRFYDGTYSSCNHVHDHEDGDQKHVHILALCSSCGHNFEISSQDKQLSKAVSKISSFLDNWIDIEDMTFQGRCQDCKN